MTASQDRGRSLASAGWLAVAAALSSGLAVAVLRAWRYPLGLPYSYTGDGYLNAMAVKGTLDHGWALHNPGVGAPAGQELHDFPFFDNLSMAVMKVLGMAFGDWPTVVNVFFLLTFPVVGVAAWLAFRRIGSSRPTATLLAVLYALAPFHFIRGEHHLFLSSYAVIPMGCALALDVLARRPLLGPSWRSSRTVFTVATVVLTAASVQYYPVLAAMLLVVAGLLRLGATRRWREAFPGGVAAAAIVVLFLANLAPNIAYRWRHGTNGSVGQRGLHETMAFSLRMIDLLMPIEQHRIGALGSRVREATPLLGGPMEAGSPALGLVASAGFVLLVAVALVALVQRRGSSGDGDSSLRHQSALALAAFLIATTGGGAAVLALAAGSPLRAWNRMSIFIAFFALASVGWCLDRLRERVVGNGRWLVAAGMAVIGVAGVLDQTSSAFALTASRAAVEQAWNSDRAFVASIEAELPEGAAVLQLPYMSFPENGSFRGMLDYEPLRAYLHADRLRFSYAAMRGREADWQASLRNLPAPVAALAAAAAGFDGVWIDRRGYPATADALEAALAGAVGATPRRSPDGAFAFVSLAGLRPPSSLARAALAPVRTTFGPGFHALEVDDGHLSNWTAGPAELVVDNPLSQARTLTLRATVSAHRPGPFTLTVTAPDGTTTPVAGGVGEAPIELRITVPPGRSTVRLDSDAGAAASPDGRTLAFRLVDPSIIDSALYDNAADLGMAASPSSPVV